jgi:hypothetical protein
MRLPVHDTLTLPPPFAKVATAGPGSVVEGVVGDGGRTGTRAFDDGAVVEETGTVDPMVALEVVSVLA